MAIAEALRVTPSLTKISLAKNNLGSEGAKALAPAIHDSPSLTSVNVLMNRLDTKAASVLLKVKEEKPMLRILCGLTHAETELNYSDEGLRPADVMLLAPEISVMASLTSVNLSENKLGPQGAKALAPALRDSPSMTEVRAALVKPSRHASLHHLFHTNVRTCDLVFAFQVNLDGFPLPIKKLKGTDPVASLDFSRKSLESASAVVIASLIRDNASVTQIDLSGNLLCDEGAKALAPAIAVNASLRSMDLRCNLLGEEGKDLLRMVVEARVGQSWCSPLFEGAPDTGFKLLLL
jgi:Ran GTPase-activating protein (RanGAP) involved in mRNA processing and transport